MFSYDDYREIIKYLKETNHYMGYKEAINNSEFAIMRHDVEYSVERAYELSKVELDMYFTSTFFFQLTNNSYNVLSRKNMAMIREMHEAGQTIGLHYALNGLTDMNVIRKEIVRDIGIMSEMLGFDIDTFSIHRPIKEVLAENIKLPGIINAYQDDFFTFGENITDETPVDVKYMSDANHIWRYGYPTEDNIKNNKKVQILTHPFAWTPEGYDNKDNYKSLIEEKELELIDSIDGECKDFKEYREYFVANAIYKGL